MPVTAAGGQDSSPDVGSFMRALGWRSFKSDPLTHPVALFETALRITHPSRGLGGSAKDKVCCPLTVLWASHLSRTADVTMRQFMACRKAVSAAPCMRRPPGVSSGLLGQQSQH